MSKTNKMKLFLITLILFPFLSFAQTANEYRIKASEAYNNDNTELAIEFINKAIELNPNTCDYYAFRALYSTSHKRSVSNYTAALPSSIGDMSKAIDLGCNDVSDYQQRGDLYKELGLNEKANKDYQTALILLKNPSSYNDYYLRATIKGKLEDYKGAIMDYTSAIDLDTKCTSCFRLYGLRAHCKARIRDYSGALADYTKNLELESTPNLETGEVYCNRGIVKLNMNDIKGACEDWRKASNMGYMRAFDLLKSNCQ